MTLMQPSIIIKSDKDLTLLNSKRIKVNKLDYNTFAISTIKIKLPACSYYPFFLDIIRRRFGQPQYYVGTCSRPYSIMYNITYPKEAA